MTGPCWSPSLAIIGRQKDPKTNTRSTMSYPPPSCGVGTRVERNLTGRLWYPFYHVRWGSAAESYGVTFPSTVFCEPFFMTTEDRRSEEMHREKPLSRHNCILQAAKMMPFHWTRVVSATVLTLLSCPLNKFSLKPARTAMMCLPCSSGSIPEICPRTIGAYSSIRVNLPSTLRL
jgi:hypothetical protein